MHPWRPTADTPEKSGVVLSGDPPRNFIVSDLETVTIIIWKLVRVAQKLLIPAGNPENTLRRRSDTGCRDLLKHVVLTPGNASRRRPIHCGESREQVAGLKHAAKLNMGISGDTLRDPWSILWEPAKTRCGTSWNKPKETPYCHYGIYYKKWYPRTGEGRE